MRTLDSSISTALAQRRLEARQLFSIVTVDSDAAYFWDDLGSLTCNVIDGISGSSVSRTFTGSGTCIVCDDIPLVNDLSVRSVQITLNQTSDAIDTYVRSYNLKRAAVEVHRAIFDPDTHSVVAAPFPRFVGFVDGCKIDTPAAGGTGAVVLRCVSHTRELTRRGTAKRSDAACQARHSGDTFYQYTTVAGGWQLFWGQKPDTVSGAAAAAPTSGPGILAWVLARRR
jgi:hypothetical protein